MIIAQSPGRTSAVIAVDRFGTSGTPALLVSPPPRAAAVTLTENLDRLVLAALADVPTLSTYATVARWEVASGPGPRRVRGDEDARRIAHARFARRPAVIIWFQNDGAVLSAKAHLSTVFGNAGGDSGISLTIARFGHGARPSEPAGEVASDLPSWSYIDLDTLPGVSPADIVAQAIAWFLLAVVDTYWAQTSGRSPGLLGVATQGTTHTAAPADDNDQDAEGLEPGSRFGRLQREGKELARGRLRGGPGGAGQRARRGHGRGPDPACTFCRRPGLPADAARRARRRRAVRHSPVRLVVRVHPERHPGGRTVSKDRAIVRIYESEIDTIAEETHDHPEIETGGSLFGLWTNAGSPTVFLATRPGSKARRTPTEFEQDAALHKRLDEFVLGKFGMQSLGLWHSHHHLGLHELSRGDVGRTMNYAGKFDRQRFCDLLCYFAEPAGERRSGPEAVTVKPYVYHNAPAGHRLPTSVAVLPGMSPVRKALDRTIRGEAALRPANARQTPYRLAESNDAEGLARPRGFWFGREDNPGRMVEHDGPVPGAAQDDGPSDYAIPNITEYVERQIEPLLRRVPQPCQAELSETAGGALLMLTLTDRNEASLVLGWHHERAVVVGVGSGSVTAMGRAPGADRARAERNPVGCPRRGVWPHPPAGG